MFRFAALVLCLIPAFVLADEVAGIKWTQPAGWKSQGQRPMRAATYTVGAEGECAVYFFGAGQGGGVQANLDRWAGQLQGGTPKIAKRTIHGLPVTTIDVSGEYTGMGGPNAPAKTSKAGYRLLGAIVEGPGGSVFFKFTAPAATVKAAEADFEKMLSSITK